MTRNTIFAILATATLASCEIETSDNGKLDGFWHLERVDTLATGNSADYSDRHIFWGVQLRLISATDTSTERFGKFYMRFSQTNDSLNITKMYENHWHEDSSMDDIGGDIPVPTVNDSVRHFGINAIPEGFAKEKLGGKRMVLRSKTLRLTFRRF